MSKQDPFPGMKNVKDLFLKLIGITGIQFKKSMRKKYPDYYVEEL